LVTTWAVLAEACHLLRRAPEERINLLQWVARGGLVAYESVSDHVATVIDYMQHYADVPMDLADASIVVVAMQTGIRDIATIDSDFDIYRLPNRTKLRNVLRKTS
jgi:uncharacterized protein